MAGQGRKLRWPSVAAPLLLAGCAAVGPDFQRPSVPWLEHWRGGSLEPLTARPPGRGRRARHGGTTSMTRCWLP